MAARRAREPSQANTSRQYYGILGVAAATERRGGRELLLLLLSKPCSGLARDSVNGESKGKKSEEWEQQERSELTDAKRRSGTQ